MLPRLRSLLPPSLPSSPTRLHFSSAITLPAEYKVVQREQVANPGVQGHRYLLPPKVQSGFPADANSKFQPGSAIMFLACSEHPLLFSNTALRCSPTGPVCFWVHDGPAAGTCKCRGLAGSRMRRPAVGLLGRTRHSTVQVCVRVCSATPAGLVQHCRSACLRRAPTRRSPVR